MVKVNKKMIISIALLFLVIGIFTSNAFAADTIETLDPDYYDPAPGGANPSINKGGSFFKKVAKVLAWIRLVGIAVALIAITIIGAKYIFISVEEKAEYKKAMVPYLIGFFMLLCTSIVIGIIAQIAEG